MKIDRLAVIACVVLSAGLTGCSFSESGIDFPGDPNGPNGPNGPQDPGVGPGYPCTGAQGDDPLGGTVTCFTDVSDPTSAPLVVVESAFEPYQGTDAVHVRLTFDPAFVDNSFGATAIGWDRGHKFKDLVGSDHAQVQLYDASGDMVFDLALDYISEDPDAPCGYASLGVDGGSGKVDHGDPAAILGWSTSLDENLNDRGYCAYTTDSPPTDASCDPSPEAPNWDYRVVYDLWVRADGFGAAGFGSARMTSVHASPSKEDTNTIDVDPGDCPVDWCHDPAGCDGGGGSCQDNADCPTGEFCNEGTCTPIIE